MELNDSIGVKTTSFPMACKEFFGYLPGMGMKDFAIELKALTSADRADLIKMFESVGYKVS